MKLEVGIGMFVHDFRNCSYIDNGYKGIIYDKYKRSISKAITKNKITHDPFENNAQHRLTILIKQSLLTLTKPLTVQMHVTGAH